MSIISMYLAILKDMYISLIDKIILTIYGPIYALGPPGSENRSTIPYVVYIYHPHNEGDQTAVRLKFFHRGMLDEVLDCPSDKFVVLDLPWGGTLFSHLHMVSYPSAFVVGKSEIALTRSSTGEIFVTTGKKTDQLKT